MLSVSLSEARLSDLRAIMVPDGSDKPFTESAETWENRVGSLATVIANETYFPLPLVATNFFEDGQTLTDGNHRYEALVR